MQLKTVYSFFSGKHVVKIPKDGYEEPLVIPGLEKEIIEKAIGEAVKVGKVWLISGMASILKEEIPAGILTPEAMMYPPPTSINSADLLPDNLPDSWKEDQTTALAISVALSKKAEKPLPWPLIQECIDGAFRARFIERTPESGSWPCDFGWAGQVRIRIPEKKTTPEPRVPQPAIHSGTKMVEAEIKPNQIQDLAEAMSDLISATAGQELKFQLRIELGGKNPPPKAMLEKVNKILEGIDPKMKIK